jgi:hypothetical protein
MRTQMEMSRSQNSNVRKVSLFQTKTLSSFSRMTPKAMTPRIMSSLATFDSISCCALLSPARSVRKPHHASHATAKSNM